MSTKTAIVALMALFCVGSPLIYAAATEAKPRTEQVGKKNILPSLFVMTAEGYAYQDGKLTLKGISPNTIIFADRPKRLAGHVPTEAVVQDWAEGRDSFEKDPPNADLSTFSPQGAKNVVVELKNPVLKADTLTYDVKILEGKMDASGGQTSLFIDIIGMPWTPLSYAGVARRTVARSVYWSRPHGVVVY